MYKNEYILFGFLASISKVLTNLYVGATNRGHSPAPDLQQRRNSGGRSNVRSASPALSRRRRSRSRRRVALFRLPSRIREYWSAD